MFRKDYLQKQLEQLGRVIAKVIADLSGLKNGMNDEGIRLTAGTLQSELDVELNELIALKPQETILFLSEEKRLAPGKLNLLADLLFATLPLYEESGQQLIAENLSEKTLLLYEYVNLAERTFSATRQQHIAALKQKRYEPE